MYYYAFSATMLLHPQCLTTKGPYMTTQRQKPHQVSIHDWS